MSETREHPVLQADPGGDAPGWAAEHRDELRAAVAEHGWARVRGLGLSDAGAAGAVFRALATGLMDEAEPFAPRQPHSPGVYSATPWPQNQPMCMHHELSYALEFPGQMMFACLAAPEGGGATGVADSQAVLDALPADLVERFEREGWILTRSYTLEFPGQMMFACLAAPDGGGATGVADSQAVLDALPADLVERFEREGWILTRSYNDEIGASVAEAFGTEDRDAVESHCRANAIEFEWQPDGGLRTKQLRSAVVHHPVSGRRCWFNQIAFLSEWTMAPEVREYLVEVYGADGLPFNTRFGGGDPIGADVVELVNEVYDAHTVREPWTAGDLLLVDNVRTAHSREAFEGEREMVVGLADPVRLADCAPTVEVSPR